MDLLTIHERILPLGAAVWASVGKILGFTPEGVINEIRRTARDTDADFRGVASDPPIDPAATMTRLREIPNEAEAFVMRMPTDRAGLLFLMTMPRPGSDCDSMCWIWLTEPVKPCSERTVMASAISSGVMPLLRPDDADDARITISIDMMTKV